MKTLYTLIILFFLPLLTFSQTTFDVSDLEKGLFPNELERMEENDPDGKPSYMDCEEAEMQKEIDDPKMVPPLAPQPIEISKDCNGINGTSKLEKITFNADGTPKSKQLRKEAYDEN